MGSLHLFFRLYCCVLLLLVDSTVLALNNGQTKASSPYHYNFNNNQRNIDVFHGNQPTFRATMKCLEWQQWNGQECICADSAETACVRATGGMVCDDQGNQYPNMCTFLITMCKRRRPIHYEIVSCGLCNKVKLTGSDLLPSDTRNGIKTFSLESIVNDSAVYLADHDPKFKIYFQHNLQKWVVGFEEAGIEKIILVLLEKSKYVQESQGGGALGHRNDSYPKSVNPYDDASNLDMWVLDVAGMETDAVFQNSFSLDPGIHVECVYDHNSLRRKKGIFSIILAIIIAVSVTTAVTSVTLRTIQMKKGCLYYPSVCEIRKKLKNELLPKLNRLEKDFTKSFGYGQSFLVELKTFGKNWNLFNVTFLDYAKLPKEQFNITVLKKVFKGVGGDIGRIWEPLNMKLQQELYLNASNLEQTLSAFYVSSTLFEITLVDLNKPFTLLTALITLSLGIVDIVNSVKYEKNLQEKLQAVKENTESKIISYTYLFSKLCNIQEKLFTEYIPKLSGFVKKINPSGNIDLFKLYQTLQLTNASFVTYNWLLSVNDNMEVIISKLDLLINTTKMFTTEGMNAIKYLKYVKGSIYNGTTVNQIWSTVKLIDNHSQLIPIQSYKDLVQFIAKDILNTTKCYAGIDLNAVRECRSCELPNIICDVPELSLIRKNITNFVKNEIPPCDILRYLPNKGPFDTVYEVIKYIADYILPKNDCYWLYPLRELRENSITSWEVNNSSLNINIKVSQNPQCLEFRKKMCSSNSICNYLWQDYIICFLNKSICPDTDCSKKKCETPTSSHLRC